MHFRRYLSWPTGRNGGKTFWFHPRPFGKRNHATSCATRRLSYRCTLISFTTLLTLIWLCVTGRKDPAFAGGKWPALLCTKRTPRAAIGHQLCESWFVRFFSELTVEIKTSDGNLHVLNASWSKRHRAFSWVTKNQRYAGQFSPFWPIGLGAIFHRVRSWE